MAAPKLSCATETTCPASADRQHNPYLRCAFGASPDRTNHSSPRTYNYIGTNEKSKSETKKQTSTASNSKATSNGSVHVARLPPKKDVVANAHTSLAYMIKKRVEIMKEKKIGVEAADGRGRHRSKQGLDRSIAHRCIDAHRSSTTKTAARHDDRG